MSKLQDEECCRHQRETAVLLTLKRTAPILRVVFCLLMSAGGALQAAGIWEVLSRPDGPGEVKDPVALSVDVLGNLYVGDEITRRIQRRTPQGDWSVIASLASPSEPLFDPR